MARILLLLQLREPVLAQHQISRKDAFDALGLIFWEVLILESHNNWIGLNLNQIPLQAESTQEFEIQSEHHFEVLRRNFSVDWHLVYQWRQYIGLKPDPIISDLLQALLNFLLDLHYCCWLLGHKLPKTGYFSLRLLLLRITHHILRHILALRHLGTQRLQRFEMRLGLANQLEPYIDQHLDVHSTYIHLGSSLA